MVLLVVRPLGEDDDWQTSNEIRDEIIYNQ